MRLDTARLTLRPMEEADAEDLHVVYSDPSTFEFIAAPPARSIDETLERIATKAAHELGYKLGSEFRGRGYATEAGRASLDFGFDHAGLDRIVAVCWPANGASWHVMEKLGMTRVGPGVFHGSESVLCEITRAAPATQGG